MPAVLIVNFPVLIHNVMEGLRELSSPNCGTGSCSRAMEFRGWLRGSWSAHGATSAREKTGLIVRTADPALDFVENCSSQLFTSFHSCLTPTLFRRSMFDAGLIQAAPGSGAQDEDESDTSN